MPDAAPIQRVIFQDWKQPTRWAFIFVHGEFRQTCSYSGCVQKMVRCLSSGQRKAKSHISAQLLVFVSSWKLSLSPRGVKRVLLEGLWCLRFMVLLLDVGFGQGLAWVSRGPTPPASAMLLGLGALVELGCKVRPGWVPGYGVSPWQGCPQCPWAWGPCVKAILLTLPGTR